MAKTKLEKKVREVEASLRDDGQIPKTTTEQRLENIEKLLNEIVDILKRKHPTSTDIFGNK